MKTRECQNILAFPGFSSCTKLSDYPILMSGYPAVARAWPSLASKTERSNMPLARATQVVTTASPVTLTTVRPMHAMTEPPQGLSALDRAWSLCFMVGLGIFPQMETG